MSNYILPASTTPLPRSLNLEQFIQTVIVGVSGLSGTLVRPKWQIAPPKQPEISQDWIAMGVNVSTPDANAYLGVNEANATTSQRHEALEIGCSIYGPNALSTCELIRDGFQIPNNREALTAANMGFVETGPIVHFPELINERWFNRYEMSIFLRREIQRTYPILTVLSARGTIHTVLGNEQYLLDWATQT